MRKLALFVLGYAVAVACAVYFLPAGLRLPLGVVLRVAKTTPGYAGGKKELIARKKVDKKKAPH